MRVLSHKWQMFPPKHHFPMVQDPQKDNAVKEQKSRIRAKNSNAIFVNAYVMITTMNVNCLMTIKTF